SNRLSTSLTQLICATGACIGSALLRLPLLVSFNLAIGESGLIAQPVPQLGLHYFAVENRDRNTIELRGKAGSEGIAFPEDLILAPETSYRVWILEAATLRVGFADFTTSESGGRVALPAIFTWPDYSPDSDGDGLRD